MQREETMAHNLDAHSEEATPKHIKDEGREYSVTRQVPQARAHGYRDVTYWLECGPIKRIPELLLLGETA